MRTLPLILLLACAPAEPPLPTLEAPVAAPWSRPDARPTLTHSWLTARPALTDLSLFAQHLPAVDRPDPAHRLDVGFGNGLAFAMLALDGPANGLHAAVGPRYRKDERTFSDLVIRLVVDGEVVPFGDEWVARPRRTSMAVTHAEAEAADLSTVDFAPRPGGEPVPALGRMLLLRAHRDADLALQIDALDPIALEGDHPALQHEDGRRMILDAAGLTETEGVWRIPVGTLQAGEEAVVPLALRFSAPDVPAPELDPADLPALLDEALEDDAAYAARGLQLEVDDPWLTDLLDTLVFTLRIQTSRGGGITPMSRYTSTWLRDTIGPVRFWTRMGRKDEAEAAVAYLLLCHRLRGDIGNACTSGIMPEDVTQAVDWDALPPLSGRVAAEGPSHIALAEQELLRWGGPTPAQLDRWPWIRRAVTAQVLTDEGLQPWSGDETFRLAMNVAFDQPLEVPWQDLAWSSNSGQLYVAANRAMMALAEAHGKTEEIATYEALAARARTGLETFVRPGGHLAALLLRDTSLPPLDLPFEDAALAGLWSGGLDADDPFALAALDGLLAVAGRGDGSIQSRPGSSYELGDLAQGVATGMLPGYTLWNLDVTGHPERLQALAQVFQYAGVGGQFAEGLLYGDRAAFMPIYDRVGRIGDTAARYRPWEGGIVADALVHSLVGVAPVPGGVRVRPQVPNGLDRLRASPITAPGVALDLELLWDGGWRLTLTSLADAPFEVTAELPLARWEDVAVVLEGEGEVVERPRGERMVRFAPVVLAPGATVELAALAAP